MVRTTTGNTTGATALTFQLLKNGIPFKATSISSLNVYDVESSSTGTIPLFVIDPFSVTVTSTGLYSYTIPIISTVGTYYDKIIFDLYETAALTAFNNSFAVAADVFSGGEIAMEPLCKIYGVVKFGDGSSSASVKIDAIPDDISSINSITHNAITPMAITSYTDDNGYFSVNLVKNTIYRFAIRELCFYQKILVPNAITCELWELTTINEVGEPTSVLPTPPTGTETNNPTPLPQPTWD